MLTTKQAKTAILFIIAATALFMTACEQKKINQILAEPDRYVNHEVGIEGHVVRSFSVLGKGAYEIDDGSGRLWIISDKGVPRTGSQVSVRGRIRDGFDLSSVVKLPDIINSGMVMIEAEHRAR